MQFINTTDLNSEFTNWVKQNGNSRNNQDLRFSQHIHNSYDLTNLNLKDDGFYIDSTGAVKSENSKATIGTFIIRMGVMF